MQMLPPQVELDLIWLVFAVATLAVALLTCRLRTGPSNAPNAAQQLRAAGPSRPHH